MASQFDAPPSRNAQSATQLSEPVFLCLLTEWYTQFYLDTHPHVHPQSEWAIPAFPAVAGTHLPTPEGWKAELAWVAGYVVRQFTGLKAVTHPATNRAQCKARGTGISGLMRGLATLPPRWIQEPSVVRDNDGRSPGGSPGSALLMCM